VPEAEDDIFDIAISRAVAQRAAKTPAAKLGLLLKTLEVVLGSKEQAIRASRSLQGCVLVFPTNVELERLLSEDLIWRAMQRDSSRPARRRVAELIGRDPKWVSATWRHWQEKSAECVERRRSGRAKKASPK
jgi:hypothetical protein